MIQYAKAQDSVKSTAELLLPPRRLKPSVAAAQYLRNEKGKYDPAVSPMMEEPLNMLASREFTGIVFVGPARSSKTASMILGAVTYIETCAPGDALIIHIGTNSANSLSREDLDRSIRHSPELAKRLSPRVRDDATFAKYWRNGTPLRIGWPAVSQLSARTLQYVMFTDYDRPENRDNVDGEGPMWDLGFKRIETFMSRGKCIAESSPGEVITDPNWAPHSKHEAPPAPGIMTLYNRGTRARWYWPCMHCGEFFEATPGFEIFGLPKEFEEIERMLKKKDPMTLSEEYAKVPCPECGALHTMDNRPQMNARGVWLHDGQHIEQGAAVGARRRSNIASYWLGGVAATYQRWDSLLLNYFQGVQTYSRTGDEETLKSVTMTDGGTPYLSRNLAKARGADTLLSRLEKWTKGMVPNGVRFLTAAIDVQSNRFVVQVQGWGVELESWLIDRLTISTGKRLEQDDRLAALQPGALQEDWLVLLDVIRKRYPLQSDPSIDLPLKAVVCDSGGVEGVTMRAYDTWRGLRTEGLQDVRQLVKGDGTPTKPRVDKTWPDARSRKQRKSGARGDVPVWILNTNILKDGIVNELARDTPGAGYVHLPLWAKTDLDDEFAQELTVETRGPMGKWEIRHGARNEAFDLHYYNRAACVMLRAENIDWSNPPPWAVDPIQRKQQGGAHKKRDIGEMARRLNG